MKYLKVKPGCGGYSGNSNFTYVENELFTEIEAKKLKIDMSKVEQVMLPKNRSYWLFGARFNATIRGNK